MKKVYAVILFLGVLFLDMACEDSTVYFNDVALINNSNDTINVAWFRAKEKMLTPKIAYVQNRFLVVPPNDSCMVKAAMPIDDYEGLLCQFMVFKKSTLDRYSKSEIIEKNIYDTLFVYDHEQLKAMNFTIKYNGK